jgi:hypothetical protein
MTTLTINTLTDEQANLIVCVFCDNYASETFCGNCGEYKGLMTLAEWIAYTGESWEM